MTAEADIEHIVARARAIHGDRYDYSRLASTYRLPKIEIICPVHGPFLQELKSHLSGAGCRKCANYARANARIQNAKNSFLRRATIIHGDKYDLSDTTYVTSRDKISVVCNTHGPFLIRASNFLRGIGCSRCGDESMAAKQKKPSIQFVADATAVHGERYDYSRVHYKSTHKGVEIICREHGVFIQRPSAHLRGRGCPRCGVSANAAALRMPQDDFIKACTTVHGGKYDYSQVFYSSQAAPIDIICATHGTFRQAASKHLAGQGCPKCANKDMTTTKFTTRAIAVHGARYDYSQSQYTRARNPISIGCPEHGIFQQRADHHLAGIGCPLCVDTLNSRGTQKISKWLTEKGVEFRREKTFEALRSEKRGARLFRFDFWLPDLRVLIEYDGRQHFEALELWGGAEGLRRTQQNDRRKDSWADENNYQLIRIRYDQEDSIADILSRALLKR